MKWITRFDRLNQGICWVLAGLMLVMVLCTLWQVAVRFLLTSFGWSIAAPWTEEVSRYAMIWIIFLGAGVACRHAQLIALEIVVMRVPPAWGKAMRYLALAGCLAFFSLMFTLGMQFMEFGEIETSPVLSLPKTWVYAAMPLGFALMFVNTLALVLACWLEQGDIRYAGHTHSE